MHLFLQADNKKLKASTKNWKQCENQSLWEYKDAPSHTAEKIETGEGEHKNFNQSGWISKIFETTEVGLLCQSQDPN